MRPMRLSPSVLLLGLMLTLAACQEPGVSPSPPPLPTPTDPSGPARVEGTVSLEDTTNAGGVQVSLVGTELRATTNAAGAFVLEEVPPGTYELTAARTGYTQARQSLSVDAEDSVEVSLALLRARGRVSGVLQLEGVTDVSGVAVALEGTTTTATTDAQGRFAMEGVPTGSYVLKVSRDGYPVLRQPVEVTEGHDTLVTLQLGRNRGRIEGRVRLDDSASSPGITVALEGTDTVTTTDEQGRFALEGVPTGTYSLLATKEGYGAQRQSVEVRAAGSSTVGLSLTRHRGRIQGQVTLDGATQAPGVTVALEGTGTSTTSTAQGLFTLASVPTGTYVLVATKARYAPVRLTVEVTTDATTTVTLPLILSRGDIVGQVQVEGAVSAAGLTVQVEGANTSATTDAQGRFALPGMLTGSYVLEVSKADHTTARQTVEVKEAATTSVTLTLARSRGRVEGVALLDDAQDPAGTQVSLQGWTGGSPATTDAQGRFVLEGVPTGTYSVITTREGYASTRPQVQVTAGATASVSVSLVRLYGSIQGRVTVEGRTNAAGVKIDLVGRSDSFTTDATGDFQFTRLLPGDYTLQATLSQFETVNLSLKVSWNEYRFTTLTMNRSRGAVKGTAVLDDVGAGEHAGTEVTLVGTSLVTTTAADGAFAFTSVPIGTYEVRARRTNYADTQASVEVLRNQEHTVSLLVPRLRGQVKGQVTLSDGGNPADAAVSLGSAAAPVPLDAQGRFTLPELPTGTYTLVARQEGYAKQTRSVTVLANATTNTTLLLNRLPTPTLTSVNARAVHGGLLALTGTHFGEEPFSTRVTVGGGAPVELVSWSDTRIVVRLPHEVVPGPRQVVLETGAPRQTLSTQTWVVSATTVGIGGAYGLGVKPDASLALLGPQLIDPPASTNQGVLSVSASHLHALALLKDGTIAAWGRPPFGYGLDQVPAGLSGVVAVAAGALYNVVLKDDGTVLVWGDDVVQAPAGISDVIAISAGLHHVLALRADGTVLAWGSNEAGATSVPEGLTEVVEVSAGNATSIARRADGSLVQWGSVHPDRPLPAGLTGVRTLGLGIGRRYGLAVVSDTQVIAFGEASSNPEIGMPPPVQTNVVSLTMGKYYYDAALHQDGSLTVFGWGMGAFNLPSQIPPGLVLRVPAH